MTKYSEREIVVLSHHGLFFGLGSYTGPRDDLSTN